MTNPRHNVPDYMDTLVQSSRDAFCDVLHNPALWSENIIQQTLTRMGGTPFDIEDVQTIVKDYLTVLSENVRKGETL